MRRTQGCELLRHPLIVLPGLPVDLEGQVGDVSIEMAFRGEGSKSGDKVISDPDVRPGLEAVEHRAERNHMHAPPRKSRHSVTFGARRPADPPNYAEGSSGGGCGSDRNVSSDPLTSTMPRSAFHDSMVR